jgi:hypothetical protein
MHRRVGPNPETTHRETLERSTTIMPAGILWTTAVSCASSGSARHLLIISRHHPGLYEYVRQRFAGERRVEVILDRRRGRDRRMQRLEAPVDRRAQERRRRPDIDAALRMESMQFLTIPPAAAPDTTPAAEDSSGGSA